MNETKQYVEHVDPPTKDEGWIEYGLQLLWSEVVGYEHVSDNAAEELAALRARLAEADEIILALAQGEKREMNVLIGEAKDYVKAHEVEA